MIALAALLGSLVGLGSSPYLSGLTVSVIDGENADWWHYQSVARSRLIATALVVAALGGLGGAASGLSAAFVGYVVIALILAPLVIIDVETKRLPNRLIFLGQVVGLVALAFDALTTGQWHALIRAVEAGALLFVVFYVVVFLIPKSFGFGDVKLLAILGAILGWFGWLEVYYGVLAGFVLGSVAGLAQIISGRGTMKSQIPFGPFLIFGAFLVLAVHRTL